MVTAKFSCDGVVDHVNAALFLAGRDGAQTGGQQPGTPRFARVLLGRGQRYWARTRVRINTGVLPRVWRLRHHCQAGGRKPNQCSLLELRLWLLCRAAHRGGWAPRARPRETLNTVFCWNWISVCVLSFCFQGLTINTFGGRFLSENLLNFKPLCDHMDAGKTRFWEQWHRFSKTAHRGTMSRGRLVFYSQEWFMCLKTSDLYTSCVFLHFV